MMKLNKLSIRLSPKTKDILVWLIPVISFAGFLDATYLTVKHYTGGSVPCGIFSGCDTVLISSYSELFGVPLALFGVAYYLAIFVLSILYIDRRSDFVFHLATRSTVIGLISSAWFVFLQLVVIKAICTFCMLSALSSLILFILGFVLTLDHITRVHSSDKLST